MNIVIPGLGRQNGQVRGEGAIAEQARERRRYYLEDDLTEIFAGRVKSFENLPTVPAGVIAEIIDKSVSFLFPEGTNVRASDEQAQPAIDELVEQLGLLDQLPNIGREGHIQGTVLLKSNLVEDPGGPRQSRWNLEIVPAEHFTLDVDPLDPNKLNSIRIRFKYYAQDEYSGKIKQFWHQEIWTGEEVLVWNDIEVVSNIVPDFPQSEINRKLSGEHGYPELPFTVVKHSIVNGSPYGEGELTETMKAYARQLNISYHKAGRACQLISEPMYKRVNAVETNPIAIASGTIVNLQSVGSQDADFAAVDPPQLQDAVFNWQKTLRAKMFDLAQVTNPDIEKEMKAGGTVSSVAFKQFNLPFIKKIEGLRRQYGLRGIEAHLAKLLRMSGELQVLDAPADLTVQLQYPSFFDPTPEEQLAELALLKQAYLPPDEMARRVAQMLNIQQSELIDAIQREIEDERAMLKMQTQLI